MPRSATIVFVTRNRKEMLRRALSAAQAQTEDVDVIVMDDASDDGTDTMMRDEFPEICYEKTNRAIGPCFHRNRGVELAQTEIVFILDDDSLLQSPRTISQTLLDFDDDAVAIVAIPFKNILQTDDEQQRAPTDDVIWVGPEFVAASHAVRRSDFLEVGGYRTDYFYMVEESDLSIRLLDQQKVVRLGRADPIFHLQPPNRKSYKVEYYHRRNSILFVVLNIPTLLLPLHLAATAVKGLWHGLRTSTLKPTLHGTWDGFRMMVSHFGARRPVRRSTFMAFRRLRSKGELRLDDLGRGSA